MATTLCGCGNAEPIVRHQIQKERSGLDGIRPEPAMLSGWKQGATNSMVPIRINKKFEDDTAEITVIPLPAAANDWDSNVKRWAANQLGLKLDQEGLAKVTSEVIVDGQVGQRVRLVDESANDKKAIIGLMVVKSDTAWFMKLMGPINAVEQAETDFDRFVSEFEFPTRTRNQPAPPPVAEQKPASTLELPDGWQEGRTNSMVPVRINKNFEDGTAEITVIPLPAAANDWDSNVKRWSADQLGLNLDQEALAKITSEITVDGRVGQRVRLVDDSASDKKAIIGLMVVESDTAWFMKLMGPIKAVEQAEADFDRFVSEFEFPARGRNQPAPPPAAERNPTSTLDLPDGWQEGRTNSMVPIRINKKFEDETAEITVVPLPADANDWKSNIERWAADQLQLNLDQASLAELTTTVTVDGQEGKRIRLVEKSTLGGKAIIGLMIVKEETAWFIKLMGPMNAVEKAEAELDDFVAKFKFPT